MRAMAGKRDEWLAADDAGLLRDCAVDTYRASGPGGQKRNKTSSAVRLRHGPSGLMVIAEESRSQHENKAKAVQRLRMAIALQVREPLGVDWRPPEWLGDYVGEGTAGRMSARNERYPEFVAVLLDALAAAGGGVREAAGLLGVSTGRFTKLVSLDGKVLAEANRIRHVAGLASLK